MCEGRTRYKAGVLLLLAVVAVAVGCGVGEPPEESINRPETTTRPVTDRAADLSSRFVVDLPCLDADEDCGAVHIDYHGAPAEKVTGRAARDHVLAEAKDILTSCKASIKGMRGDLRNYDPEKRKWLPEPTIASLAILGALTRGDGNDSMKLVEAIGREIERGGGLGDANARRRVLDHLHTIDRGIDEALAVLDSETGPDASPDGGK